jgi:hypothetical protein
MADPIDPIDPVAKAIAKAHQATAAAVNGTKKADVVPMRRNDGGLPDGVLCQPGRDFLADASKPVWLLGNILQRGYLYALTAPTNHGKTAVSLVMAVCIAAGKKFAGLETGRGPVLILCGENQDGFRLRLLATMQLVGVTMDDIDGNLWVLPYSTGLSTIVGRIGEESKRMGELALVLVDTSVSFFSGVDENNNTEAYEHARTLRMLTELNGRPAVIANCHPTGNAEREKCVPRGGSAFLNEIDANLIVWSDGDTSEFHWQTKKRGPDFDPIWFEYRPINVEYWGEQHPTIVAVPIGEGKEREIRQRRREDENKVLYVLLHHPTDSFSEWARGCHFLDVNGNPIKSKVFRVLERLKSMKLVENSQRKGWHLTKYGKDEAQTI